MYEALSVRLSVRNASAKIGQNGPKIVVVVVVVVVVVSFG